MRTTSCAGRKDHWFKKGFKSGNPNVCNTWQADKL